VSKRKTRRQKKRTIGQVLARKLLVGARERARRKKLLFRLNRRDERWISQAIDNGKCQLTGLPFAFEGGLRAPSLDRICCVSTVVADKSYVASNVRVVLWAINNCFSNWGQEAFMSIMTESRKMKATLWRPLQQTVVERPQTR